MQEQNVKEESHVEYEYLTSLVRESIERVVPPKTWTEKMTELSQSEETKTL